MPDEKQKPCLNTRRYALLNTLLQLDEMLRRDREALEASDTLPKYVSFHAGGASRARYAVEQLSNALLLPADWRESVMEELGYGD